MRRALPPAPPARVAAAAIRGAVNGLMAEVLESHLREEFGELASSDAAKERNVQQAIALVRSYLK